MLGFVIRNSREFKSGTKILLYNSLVRSTLDYCSVVFRPHYADHILRIERVQKRFLWHLAYSTGKAKLLESYTSRLQYFRMHSLSSCREAYDALFLFKLIRNQIDCPDLLSVLRFRAPSRYPRQPITPLCPPLRRTVLGANHVIPRLCRTMNGYIVM